MSRIDHQRELDDHLLRSDRRLSWAIVVAILLGYAFAFGFADPGSPASELLAKTTSAVRG